MTAKKVLGRGLDALIPRGAAPTAPAETTGPAATSGAVVQYVDVAKLSPNPRQPRRRFPREEILELAASIKEHGVLQPLLTRAAAKGYEIVAGERRLAAAREAGLAVVPCIVRDIPDELLLPIALVENLQREDLNPVEEALAFRSLHRDHAFTHDDIARAVGKSRVAITNTLRLLELAPAVLEMLEKRELVVGQARPLIGLAPASKQVALARRIARRGLSARQVEALVNRTPGKKKRPPARTPEAEPYFDAVIRRLENRLATKVRINGTARRGAVEIHYFSAEDLERILDAIDGKPKH